MPIPPGLSPGQVGGSPTPSPVDWHLPDFKQSFVDLGLTPSQEHYDDAQYYENWAADDPDFTAADADYYKGKSLIKTGFNPILATAGAFPYQIGQEVFRDVRDQGISGIGSGISSGAEAAWNNLRGIGSAVKSDWLGKVQSGFGFLDQPKGVQAHWSQPAANVLLPALGNYLGNPANIRAANKFFSGDPSPATEQFFRPDELDLIKSAARQSLEDRRDFINYEDWSLLQDSGALRSEFQDSWTPPGQHEIDAATFSELPAKATNLNEIMETTLGQAGGHIYGGTDEPYRYHYPGLGIQNVPVGPTGRYDEPHLTLRDVYDFNPGQQPSRRTPFYQALMNLGEHLTTTQGSQYGFPWNIDLGLASDYVPDYRRAAGLNIPMISGAFSKGTGKLQEWEDQSTDWYTPRYPTKEKSVSPPVTWGEGNILQTAKSPSLSAVSQALTPDEIKHKQEYILQHVPEESHTYVKDALSYIHAGESEQEEQVQEIERKPREERSSVEEQVVVASKVRKALDNAAKGKKVKNEFRAITELAKTDPTIAKRYTNPLSQDLIDITSQVESFASIPKKKKKKKDVDSFAFEDLRGGRR